MTGIQRDKAEDKALGASRISKIINHCRRLDAMFMQRRLIVSRRRRAKLPPPTKLESSSSNGTRGTAALPLKGTSQVFKLCYPAFKCAAVGDQLGPCDA